MKGPEMAQFMSMLMVDDDDFDDDDMDEEMLAALLGGGRGGVRKKPSAGKGMGKASAPPKQSTKKAPAAAPAPTAKPTTGPLKFAVGDKIWYDKFAGIVRFVGPVHYSTGVMIGVEMEDGKVGKNDGSVKGTQYFTCPPGSGLMLREADLRRRN